MFAENLPTFIALVVMCLVILPAAAYISERRDLAKRVAETEATLAARARSMANHPAGRGR